MTIKEINKLDKIIETIRDFRDDIYCLATDTDTPKDCTCYKYDQVIDQLEKIKNE
tara:strand:- start:59 stop:223 length:165 start_codon:yes stop_codon:yes gene_type:complete